LHRYKPELLRLLSPSLEGWSAKDCQAFFDERAAIYEFEGGLPRAEAEAGAFDSCVVEWLNRNVTQSPPGRCLNCGGGEPPGDPLLPFGNDRSGHAWLHRACWPAWYRAREAEAIATLSEMDLRKQEDASEHERRASSVGTAEITETNEQYTRTQKGSDMTDDEKRDLDNLITFSEWKDYERARGEVEKQLDAALGAFMAALDNPKAKAGALELFDASLIRLRDIHRAFGHSWEEYVKDPKVFRREVF